MTKKVDLNPADYIEPLYMNGLHGRMLRLRPSPRKNKEILVIYGQHNSLERLFSFGQALNKYGGVTIPDLPGFGGMQPFYKLKEKPSIDNLADYVASFVKLRYKNRRVTIVGLSFGFVVVTRMLQRYPEIAKKTDLLISGFGFVHHEDLLMSKTMRWWRTLSSGLLSRGIVAKLSQQLFLQPTFIRMRYNQQIPGTSKAAVEANRQAENRIAYETHLWRTNDLRTHAMVTGQILKLDLCDRQVELPVYHIELSNDANLNNQVIEQHLGVIYSDVHNSKSSLKTYQAAEMTDSDAAKVIPSTIKKLLAKT